VKPSSSDVVVVVNGTQLSGAPTGVEGRRNVISAGSGTFIYAEHSTARRAAGARSPSRRLFSSTDAGCVAHPLLTRSTPIGRDAANTIIVRDATASRFSRRGSTGSRRFSRSTRWARPEPCFNGALQSGPCLLNEGDHVRDRLRKVFGSRRPTRDPTSCLRRSILH